MEIDKIYNRILNKDYTTKKVGFEDVYKKKILKEQPELAPSIVPTADNPQAIAAPQAPTAEPAAPVNEYDRVILEHLKKLGVSPEVKGINLEARPSHIDPHDLPVWEALYELTPPKKKATKGSTKGSGNGEMSLYWLLSKGMYKQEVVDSRSKGQPDLRVNGMGLEVKAYDKISGGMLSLGRFREAGEIEGKDNNILLNSIFGLSMLTKKLAFKSGSTLKKLQEAKEELTLDRATPSDFNSKVMIEAFTQINSLYKAIIKAVDESQKVGIDLLQYDIFETVFEKIYTIYDKLGIPGSMQINASPEECTRKLFARLAITKLTEKPGDNGFIVNVSPTGHLEWYKVELSKIESKIGADSISARGSALQVSTALFN